MPEQKKQNWFAKHRILTAIIAIIVVMYVGGSIGLSQETPTAERSLEQKQEIFYKVTEAEDKATKEAREQFPTDPSIVTDSNQLTENVEQNADLTVELQAKYKQEVLNQYGLTEEEWQEIMLEGATNDWPTPSID